ncbi:MAG: TRAP transporter large permease subunit [bacterium]
METYRKFNARLCLVLALAFSAFELYTVGFGILSPFAQRATMFAFASVLVFLLYPIRDWPRNEDLGGGGRTAAILWDASFVAGALLSCIFLVVDEEGLADRSGAETLFDLLIAVIGPIVLMEMVRRVAGIPLFLVTLSVIVYTYWGDVVLVLLGVAVVFELIRRFVSFQAALGLAAIILVSLMIPEVRGLLDYTAYPFRGESHERMAAYLWLTSEGTFGTIAAIMSEFIFIFILFAALLEATGTGQILINLAFGLTGRFRGGPAQAAVVASSMFGMVSGSTMANVVSTGTFTIPLMIRTGFSRLFAGAVEAVASCGGQIVPPIMGASIFIMSEIIGVPYVYLMLYALIPAFLYYFSLSASVYFESSRLNLRRLDDSEIPVVREEIMRGGYLLIPVVILLASIISGETPGLAGFKAVVSLIVMVDLVRALRWIRSRWAAPGVSAAGVLILLALFLAYGPVSAPQAVLEKVDIPLLGPIPWIRLLLFGAGVLFAVLPPLRGLPIALPVGLSIARWQFPSELLWMGQIPYVGILLPIAFGALGIFLIAAPVFSVHESVSPDESARELGRSVLTGLENGAKNSLGLVAATSTIGLIVGLLVLAALGVRISILVTEVASTSLIMAFLLVMVASLVLGMGLPTIAAYLLLVIVVAPSVTKLGAPLVAAHMFIFYFGVISSLTPPVALAAYAASGISGANAMRTGFTSCRLAVTAFIVPYLFVYYPELLLIQGTFWEVAYRLLASCAGIFFVSMAAMGYGFAPLGAGSRIILLGAAFLLFLSSPWLNAAGLILGCAHIFYQVSGRRRALAPQGLSGELEG